VATYRVVNELGVVQVEYPVYSLAYTDAYKLYNTGGRQGHYKIEQVEVVFDTACFTEEKKS